MKLSIEERFWRNTRRTRGCWLWLGRRTAGGYGTIYSKVTGPIYAHRLSLMIHGVRFRASDNVCHHCDNPSCVNPAHLFVGSQRDNLHDAALKHRMHPKLTREQVQQIRTSLKSDRALAREFGISRQGIRYRKHGRKS